jgi:hypothetical protein
VQSLPLDRVVTETETSFSGKDAGQEVFLGGEGRLLIYAVKRCPDRVGAWG